ncbi:MAG TPA: sialidase family protein, partial [Candidatus Methylomirabilis sp.]|nr:sialidase family protein [Candidatus Methylomirabilis sp.]
TVGTQDMPPSWTNNTDPTVDFDIKGRVYQVTLPFNAFWANLHPNSHIEISYSDDMGRHWVKGNGGQALEHTPNWSSLSLGFVEDKQWVVVNKIPGHPYQDHVYAVWSIYNGSTTELRVAVSRDRGLTFAKATTFTMPSETGPSNQFVFPAIDAAGDLYVSFASLGHKLHGDTYTLTAARSTDDGVTFEPFVPAATAGVIPGCCLPNTTFRDGVAQSLAASPDHPGHVYMAYESWDHANGQMDVYFTQSTDHGATWSAPVRVNDNAESATLGFTDQFQPSVAAGPQGAVAVVFYDRRSACPDDASIRAQDVSRTNFCIDVTLQAYKDSGSGAAPILNNVRITKFTWDPMQPDQHVDGIGQMACAGHSDPCTSRAFIGDYFGLAISASNIYALFTSTHYPSSVTADEGGPVYYQQQVLATLARSQFGARY